MRATKQGANPRFNVVLSAIRGFSRRESATHAERGLKRVSAKSPKTENALRAESASSDKIFFDVITQSTVYEMCTTS